jgi:hypothetical protein
MLRKLRSRLTYANVVATLALFVAVGTGGAYAANTVFSTDIVNGEVKSVDIGDNEIGSADVKDNTINTFDVHSFLGVDVVDGTLTGADVDESTLGTVPDADTLDGRSSNSFLTSSKYKPEFTAPAGSPNINVTARVDCNPGDPAIGGGVSGNLGGAPINLFRVGYGDTGGGTGFFQIGWHNDATPKTPTIQVICLDQTPDPT